MNDHEMSLKNPLVKRIKRLLESARYRMKEEAFWVEGVPLIRIAPKDTIEMVVYCDDLLIGDEGRRLFQDYVNEGIRCVAVSTRIFRHVSDRNNPDGLGAICRAQWRDISSLSISASDVVVAAEGLSDPGNLGTVLRTMDAVQAAALILVGQTTQPFHPRTVRASRGAIFTVPLYRCPDTATLFDWAVTNNVQAIATSANARRSFWKTAYTVPSLFLFGNEHRGLDGAAMRAADKVITIPMGGVLSSLNIAVAVSLVLYEVKRLGTS